MTIETRTTVELPDLAAVVISCVNCTTSLRLPLTGRQINLPDSCPNCGFMWFAPSSVALSKADSLKQFVQALHNLSMALDPKYSLRTDFTLSLEISTQLKAQQ